MVWRSSLFVELNRELNKDFSNLFIELLKITPLYVFVDKIGSRNGIPSIHSIASNELKECLSDPKFQAKKGLQFLYRPIFKFVFNKNVRFFRLFYKEMEQLPLVIRYDLKNDSYFLDNY